MELAGNEADVLVVSLAKVDTDEDTIALVVVELPYVEGSCDEDNVSVALLKSEDWIDDDNVTKLVACEEDASGVTDPDVPELRPDVAD